MLLKQFLGLFGINVKQHFAYRFDFLVWTTVHIIYIVVQYFLWKAIYANTGQTLIGEFTFIALMQYFVLGAFTTSMSFSYTDSSTANRIRSGSLVKQITKPIKYITMEFVDTFSNRVMAFVVEQTPILIIGFLFFELSTTFVNGLFYAISLVLAMLLSFLLVFSFGLSAFWTKKYDGIRRVREGVFWLFSGTMIPLSFFPEIAQKIFSFFPFQYIIYVPVRIFLGHFTPLEILKQISIQVFWIVLFFIIANKGWKIAYKKYTGVGI